MPASIAAPARCWTRWPTRCSDRVLTYRGFIARKTGNVELGMAYYRQAIARNPDNLLVRSYMGQSLVEQGKPAEARVQLVEILARGGAGTWPAESLRIGDRYRRHLRLLASTA